MVISCETLQIFCDITVIFLIYTHKMKICVFSTKELNKRLGLCWWYHFAKTLQVIAQLIGFLNRFRISMKKLFTFWFKKNITALIRFTRHFFLELDFFHVENPKKNKWDEMCIKKCLRLWAKSWTEATKINSWIIWKLIQKLSLSTMFFLYILHGTYDGWCDT